MKFVIFIFIALLSACSTLKNSQTSITEHGQYAYYSAGDKKPTLVFESGLADDMTVWQNVLSALPAEYEVFAYNRAGFSGSTSNTDKRSGAVIVEELNALLEKQKLTPPFILVGHSLGGGYMELYAKTFPHNVAGVVLVDPNSSKYPAACRELKLNYCEPPSSIPFWASMFLPKAVSGEIEGFAKTHEQINSASPFPQVPTVVITAMATRNVTSEQDNTAAKLYLKMHKELASQSSVSKHLVCQTCTHNIHIDRPDLVVEGINWVIDNNKK